jgi:hypothetical protein
MHVIIARDRRQDHGARPHGSVDDRTPAAVEAGLLLRAGTHGQAASAASQPSTGLTWPVVRKEGQAHASFHYPKERVKAMNQVTSTPGGATRCS